jgi:hypothetical protein
MEEPGPQPWLMGVRLIDVLLWLAAEPADQVAYAHSRNNLSVDELILDYVDWAYYAVPGLSEAGLLPPGALELLDELNDCLGQEPASPDYDRLPCEQAVLFPMWAQGRELARSILDLFVAAGVCVPAPGWGG